MIKYRRGVTPRLFSFKDVNMAKFNKLRSNSNFPDIDNVNVYKFDNEFDYSRYDATQMSLQICTVPWDVGEAHVGQRTISGIGNVVWFESKEARNAWFDAIPDDKCYRFETKYKELHRNQTIDVPIPFDVCSRFNYLVVKYNLFANDDSPVKYENKSGLREWFWFIREVEYVSANTTRLHLLDDAFQTWMYDVNVSSMILERGHAPMFAMKADEYLKSPIDNNDYLLCEDINYGSPEVVKSIDALALNGGDMWACVATTAYPRGEWGEKSDDTWRVAVSSSYSQNGVPSVSIFAMEPANLSSFLSNLTSSIPQFKQTIQGVFFAPKDLVSINTTFTFADVECHTLTSSRKTLDLTELSKDKFGYDAKYSDIAKLYTYPYAHIEITDENGNIDIVKIEDTTGNIDVSAALSLAFPFIGIDAHLLGVGGKASLNVTFRNVTSRSFNIAGNWYETLRSWKIPTFAIVQSNAKQYDYSTHFDRIQRKIDYDTEYDNAAASASTTKSTSDRSSKTELSNTNRMAQANKTTADNSADNLVANAKIRIAANSEITSQSNVKALQDTGKCNDLKDKMNFFENKFIEDTTNNEIKAAEQTAAVGIASSAVSGLSAAASGQGFGGLVNGVTSGIANAVNTAIATNLQSSQAALTKSTNTRKTNEGNTNANERITLQNQGNTNNTNESNKAIDSTTKNDASTQKENATTIKTATNNSAAATNTTNLDNNQEIYNTSIANANRNKERAKKAIENDVKQAAIGNPIICGAFSDGESATTKPMALFANIVTQSKSAISSAGDEFLRYGYMFDKQWKFNGNWNVGKYFTYWKLKDFWVTDLNIPDMYMDKLRFFLFGGVTIWRKPEYIGKIDIYENFN